MSIHKSRGSNNEVNQMDPPLQGLFEYSLIPRIIVTLKNKDKDKSSVPFQNSSYSSAL